MPEIIWKESYAVGVEEIDRQHQDFVKLIRRLQILQEKGNAKHLVVRLIRELGAYAEYHFISEENIMYLTRFPDLARQEAEHGKLLGSFREKVKGYDEGRVTLEAFIQFLISWFETHSTEEDKQIGRHVLQPN